MKLSKLFFGLAAAAMFAACSSDDIVQEQNQIKWNEDGTGYMAFNLTMPQQTGTRANDDFDKGDADEYSVSNVTLLLFDGTTFHSAYTLTGTDFGDKTDGTNDKTNITADNKYVFKVDSKSGLNNPQAFVVLNNNGIFSVVDGNIKINETTYGAGTPFATMQALLNKDKLDFEASAFHGTGFLMMNAPLFNAKGGPAAGAGKVSDGTVNILTKVNAGAIYETKEKAEKGTAAANVYVERAVAKVTLKQDDFFVGTNTAFSAELKNWTLDNTNRTSYLVRSIDGFDAWKAYLNNGNYRMAGSESVAHGTIVNPQDGEAAKDPVSKGETNGMHDSDNQYRTYFAKDTNYEGIVFGTDPSMNIIAKSDYESKINKAIGSNAYCAENTFDVPNMDYQNTTRALISAVITPSSGQPVDTDGKSFYGMPGGEEIYTKDQVKVAAQKHVVELIADALHEGCVATGTPSYATADGTDAKHVKVTVSGVTTTEFSNLTDEQKNAYAVKYGHTDYASCTDAEKTELETEYTNVKTALDNVLAVSGVEYHVGEFGYGYYENGVSYYDVRIKHFGDDLTPWTATLSSTTAEAYNVQEEKFLGRWGVLRNNWYELSVTKIAKLGYADPADLALDPDENDHNPDYGKTPDDNKEREMWISVDVNILSWAKRTQNVEF